MNNIDNRYNEGISRLASSAKRSILVYVSICGAMRNVEITR